MTVRATLVLFLCIACATTTFAQTSTSSSAALSGGSATVYDNFNEKFLDPLRWNLSSSCFAGSGLEMECGAIYKPANFDWLTAISAREIPMWASSLA